VNTIGLINLYLVKFQPKLIGFWVVCEVLIAFNFVEDNLILFIVEHAYFPLISQLRGFGVDLLDWRYALIQIVCEIDFCNPVLRRHFQFTVPDVFVDHFELGADGLFCGVRVDVVDDQSEV